MKICAIILSAGKSNRFNSDKPKFMHEISGQQIINYNINAVKKIKKINKLFIITSSQNKKYFENIEPNIFIQNPLDGTGGALKQFAKVNKNFDYYLVLLADTPIFEYKILQNFLNKSISQKNDVSVISQFIDNPEGYGRIVIEKNSFYQIIEDKDCNAIQKKINLVNTGIFLISKTAISNIDLIKRNINKKEFYLTDLVSISKQKNMRTFAYINKETEIRGVNTISELNELETLSQIHIKKRIMNAGAIIHSPETVYIEENAKIKKGVIIEPNVVIKKNVSIKNGTTIRSFSYLEDAKIGSNCIIGPFARLRPGTTLEGDNRIGNFVEIKKSKLSKGVKANHLTYIGDTTVGKNTNIGAGTITCNYDGKNKLSCKIGNNSFIGSNTSIVAPVEIGANSYIAAGSVITKNIPKKSFSISRAKQKIYKNRVVK